MAVAVVVVVRIVALSYWICNVFTIVYGIVGGIRSSIRSSVRTIDRYYERYSISIVIFNRYYNRCDWCALWDCDTGYAVFGISVSNIVRC